MCTYQKELAFKLQRHCTNLNFLSNPTKRWPRSRGFPMLARLEPRQLMTTSPAVVTAVIADNRGEVIYSLSKDLDPSTVKSRSVQMHTIGLDGVFGTADDVKILGRVRWFASNNRIVFKTSKLPANTTYSMKLSAKRILDADGLRLDGEFNGAGKASGNGIGGGDNV